MKWTKKKYRLKDRKGEVRIIKRFLFLPKSFNGEVRWLEKVDIMQKVKIVVGNGYKWKSIKFK